MVVNYESQNTVLRLWLLLHRVRDAISLCEDSILRKYGLTTEQFSVLSAVKSRGGSVGSVKVVDLVNALERSPNSVSMLVDRMVQAGLVRRTRDRKDRRVVRVSATSKGEKALEPATPVAWEFIQKILSALSDKDRQALASLLEIVKCEALGYLNPEVDMAEIIKNSFTNDPGLYKRWVKNVFPSTPQTQRQGGKKKKAI